MGSFVLLHGDLNILNVYNTSYKHFCKGVQIGLNKAINEKHFFDCRPVVCKQTKIVIRDDNMELKLDSLYQEKLKDFFSFSLFYSLSNNYNKDYYNKLSRYLL